MLTRSLLHHTELDGHTSPDQAAVARVSSLVRLHFLGTPHYPVLFPHTDYFVSSKSLTPPDYLGGSKSTERLLLLPQYLLHRPDAAGIGNWSRTGQRSEQRSRLGLGSEFLFACLNQGKKMERTLFAVWMDVLRRYKHARLWLPQVTSARARCAFCTTFHAIFQAGGP